MQHGCVKKRSGLDTLDGGDPTSVERGPSPSAPIPVCEARARTLAVAGGHTHETQDWTRGAIASTRVARIASTRMASEYALSAGYVDRATDSRVDDVSSGSLCYAAEGDARAAYPGAANSE